MMPSPDHPMIKLVEHWTQRFGYYDNRIDLKVDDLTSFTTADAQLITHGPLWGGKEGEEKSFPVAEVRKRLARALRISRATRHDMHLALHPDGMQLCLFFRIKARLRLLPITVQNVPLAFVVLAAETDDGLKIDAVHEWAAEGPAAARQAVVDQHGWPTETELSPYVSFGALS